MNSILTLFFPLFLLKFVYKTRYDCYMIFNLFHKMIECLQNAQIKMRCNDT